MNNFDIGDLIQTYDKYAEERNHAGLDGRKISHITEAIQLFSDNGVRSILEIGSGPGNAAQLFFDKGFEIECADVSPNMIDLVRAKGIIGHVIDCRDIKKIGMTYDGVFSVNCLLHLPKAEMVGALKAIHSTLKTNGLFLLGLWGGEDFEGIWEQDRYRPARFFMLYSQHPLLSLLTKVFQIEEYRRIAFGEGLFFHNLVLRKSF